MNKKSSIDMLRERIKTLKNENRETQKTFAERCDISPNTLSNLMTRGKAIQYDDLEKIADACNVSIDWLVGRTDIREVQQSKQSEMDYYGLTYGEICKVITFLAAANVIHIIPDKEKGNVNIQIMDETIKGFLETLVALSLASVGKKSVCVGLHAWFESETQRLLNENVVKEVVADKYDKAFPWKTADVKFDYSDIEEWTMESPADEFDTESIDFARAITEMHSEIDENGNIKMSLENWRPLYMESYGCLIDGIVGYPHFSKSCAQNLNPTLPQIEDNQPDNT